MSYQSSLARARGLGSAKEGLFHWWMQRVTGLALVPLVIWLVYSLAMLGRFQYEGVMAWVSQPLVSIALICLALAMFYHSSFGIQVVAEDYIHTKWKRLVVIIGANFINIVLAIVSIFALVKISLGPGLSAVGGGVA